MLELIVISLVDVLFQAFGHLIDGKCNVGECRLIKAAFDPVIQLILSKGVQPFLNRTDFPVDRAHGQAEHQYAQRRKQQDGDQQLRCIRVRPQKQLLPRDRVVDRAAALCKGVHCGKPSPAVRLENAAPVLDHCIGKFHVFFSRIIQKLSVIAQNLKLQAGKRQIFFCKLLDLADAVAKQQNALGKSGCAARYGDRIRKPGISAVDLTVNFHQTAFVQHLFHKRKIHRQDLHRPDTSAVSGGRIVNIVDLSERRIGCDPVNAVISDRQLRQHAGDIMHLHRGQTFL